MLNYLHNSLTSQQRHIYLAFRSRYPHEDLVPLGKQFRIRPQAFPLPSCICRTSQQPQQRPSPLSRTSAGVVLPHAKLRSHSSLGMDVRVFKFSEMPSDQRGFSNFFGRVDRLRNTLRSHVRSFKQEHRLSYCLMTNGVRRTCRSCQRTH